METEGLKQLSKESQAFYQLVQEQSPELLPYGIPDPNQAGEIMFSIAPAGNRDLALVIWMCDGEPSVGFGNLHTHGSVTIHDLDDEKYYELSLLEFVRAIRNDQILIIRDELSGSDCLVWADQKDMDEHLLTDSLYQGGISLLSYSGKNDRRVR
ncbi:hypothetical protein [Oligoflexus tunisiensis]|uniref:hypothetical protein n=1 Tax=Oligoflexus tunisiensis TaxID=708132 RepID=UPI00114CE20B|nr:hypothetical protein [Oligoflexus tunisiensis]